MSNSTEVGWNKATWKEINEAVLADVGKVRIAQKVFPSMLLETNPTVILK
ncbi:hypothetical protein [Nitrosospira sp. Is2]|nr:hypothetical protein [Nitrosospira sp. Is2]WON73554.1 hypothetical protein R5L00_13900 [Nitrosospira sp. Is2]